jgi:UDP-N-acetylmuramate: L-alanyl-gamma-D-glutamyl-meso-diaminopimelate ligase
MRIYFMGIAGTAMGQAALLLRALGHEVCGADSGVYPPMSTLLEEAGVDFFDGYSAERLSHLQPELVVIGNAMSRGHPEVEWLLETNAFPCTSLPELIGSRILQGRERLVIAGTHGKTTTTAMAACLLRAAGANPGWLVGGAPLDLPGGAQGGDPKAPFVIEGDEYDSAFFDKRSKFIHYRPTVLVLNNLEFDHGDIFRDLPDIQRTFRHVLRLVPRNGWIVANGDDPNLEPLLREVSWAPVLRVGTGEDADWRLHSFAEDAHGSSFQLESSDLKTRFGLRLACGGLFNARNAAMALCGVAKLPGLKGPGLHEPHLLPWQSLARFRGVKRRQEIFYESPKVLLMEDFGHHPSALQQTLQSLRQRFPEHRLIAAFEPRSNTAVTNRFQEAFTEALALADHALLAPVHRAEKIPAAERLNPSQIVQILQLRGVAASAPSDFNNLFQELTRLILEKSTGQPVLLVLFSNGAFEGFRQKFCEFFNKVEKS